ncbi:MAG: NYN domain-containing protein [Planctomycetes bacterium]|nr:NYN domain-containing protein [Planctomycetota bacterium]
MVEQVLVDAHNLLHKLIELSPRFPRGIGDQRKATANLLANYASHYRRRVVAFFDGGAGPEGEAAMTRPLLRAIFTPNAESADDAIADYLLAQKAPQRILVVSSDKEVADHARHLRANVASSETFARTLLRLNGEGEALSRPPEIKHQHAAPDGDKAKIRRKDFADLEAEMLAEAESFEQELRKRL